MLVQSKWNYILQLQVGLHYSKWFGDKTKPGGTCTIISSVVKKQFWCKMTFNL